MRGGVLFAYPIMLMHEVVPNVVAIAVRMVMAKCSIFCQRSLFILISDFLISDFF